MKISYGNFKCMLYCFVPIVSKTLYRIYLLQTVQQTILYSTLLVLVIKNNYVLFRCENTQDFQIKINLHRACE